MVKALDPTDQSLRDNSAGLFRFLLLLSYSALIFSASATVASLVMLDYLGELIAISAKLPVPTKPPHIDDLLEDYGAGRRWKWAKNHCECIST